MMKTFSIGGIHPNDSKISKDCRIEVLPVPSKVYISVAQHLGAPATPIVKAGDQVKVGQVIAEPAGFISAYVHSSVSGTVKSVGPRKDIAGNNVVHIEIDVEGDEWVEGVDLTDTIVTEIPEDDKATLEKIKNADAKAQALIDSGVRQCVDCACCSYVCPASRPLLQINWEAKAFLKKYAAEQKEKKEANING